jgi:hypothetical protein
MSVSVDNRRTRVRKALTAALTVLILIPAGILFARAWDTISDDRDSTTLEQQGVEYLSALAPLVSALAEAQSSALAGVSATPASLIAAIDGVAAADERFGESLDTRERWAGLRHQIEQLPSATGTPPLVFQAHVEVSDLTLALYNAVRNNSELVRDPDNDLSHLQQAIAVDLPLTVVQVSRMGDLSQLVAEANAKTREQLSPQFGAAVQSVNTAVNSLTDNLQAAVDDTRSSTLSGNLVSGLNSFRQGVESLTRGANPGGAPNTATMATAQSQLQVSLANLAGIVSREMTTLLDDRLDSLDTAALTALVCAAAVVLLVAAVVVLPRTGEPRRATAPEAGADPGPAGAGPGGTAHDEANPMRRERFGALR